MFLAFAGQPGAEVGGGFQVTLEDLDRSVVSSAFSCQPVPDFLENVRRGGRDESDPCINVTLSSLYTQSFF